MSVDGLGHVSLAFKAGRSFRRDDTNWIDPNPTKGAIIMRIQENLTHFLWKNRETNAVEDDLILFPGDATFYQVRGGGRTWVLKFSSSNQRHFFWFQDADTSRDLEFVSNVNRLLVDPSMLPIWGPVGDGPHSTLIVPESEGGRPLPPINFRRNVMPSSEELQSLQSIVSSMSQNSSNNESASANTPAQSEETEISLTDILTPANLNPLFRSHPEMIPALFPHLPPDLPVPPSPDVLRRIISSPQFRAAVRNFDLALRTGLLANLVTSLGLPQEAGTGIEAFLRAIQEQARPDDTMDAD